MELEWSIVRNDLSFLIGFIQAFSDSYKVPIIITDINAISTGIQQVILVIFLSYFICKGLPNKVCAGRRASKSIIACIAFLNKLPNASFLGTSVMRYLNYMQSCNALLLDEMLHPKA